MEEYYFLFGLALIWMVFATIQDFKTREISNWLNFSLIAIALGYRGFYAIDAGDIRFFLFGLGGVLLFTSIAYILYYARAFAGGDAKLLMGLGAVLPFQSVLDYLTLGTGFVLLLFFVGAIYSVAYTAGFALKGDRRGKFVSGMKKEAGEKKIFVLLGFVAAAVLGFLAYRAFQSFWISALAGLFGLIMPWIYIYAKVIDKNYMIKLVNSRDLTEGDWLERDIKIGNKMIKKSVHGLSLREIDMLRKAKRNVWIKEGVPFGIAFLIAFLVFVIYYLAG